MAVGVGGWTHGGFLAVVDHGEVHRATQALFLAQPPLSQSSR